MQGCWATLVLTTALGAAPPQLGRDTFAAHSASLLEVEVQELAARAAIAHPQRRALLDARVNVRRLARQLLVAGDGAGPEGSSAVIAGLCLSKGMGAIDTTLERVAATPLTVGDLPVADVHALDLALERALTPLLEAVASEQQRGPVSFWVADPRHLGERLASGPLRTDTRDELGVIADYLARGSVYSDLRPAVERHLETIAGLLGLVAAADAAAWIDGPAGTGLDDRIHEAVVLFRQLSTRGEGETRLRRLSEARAVIVSLSALADVAPRLDLAAAREALLAQLNAEAITDAAPARWGRLRLVVDRMVAYRALSEPDLEPELRLVRRRLDEAYLRAERALATRTAELITASGGLADPALASLVADHQQYLDDLRRIEQLPAWIDQVRAIDPAAAGPFGGQVRLWSQWLLDNSRRPQVVLAMERFERELRLLGRLPQEDALRRGDLAAATGARGEELAATIDAARKAWAQAWGRGEVDGLAGFAMLRLQRLLAAMEACRDLVRLGSEVMVLNRWSAWELDDTTFARSVADIPNRFKLATAAAIGNDERGLERQLENLETEVPVAALIGRLAAALGDLPGSDDALDTLAQVALPPHADAWMLGQRRELADLCRYAMEREYARATGRAELTERLDVYVNALAERLRAAL
jgi:hypothetical protein